MTRKLILTIPYIILGAIAGIIMYVTELWQQDDPFLFWWERDL